MAARAITEELEQRLCMATGPIITEFLAINNTGLTDEDSDRGDWLELHNPTPNAINLDGYYLTDSENELANWRIPAITLPAGGYRTIFADGKDRSNPAGILHTDFSLGGGGGYLALVAPDGTTVVSEYAYGQQAADVSYGAAVFHNATTFVGESATSRVHVPTSSSLGTTWRDPTFNDGSWTPAVTGVGFDADPPISAVNGFRVRMVDTSGGTDGNISDLTEAIALLDGTTASGAFTVAFDGQGNRTTVNFGGGGSYAGDVSFLNNLAPTSANNTAGREQFAMRMVADVVIPAGTWSINVASDDGFRVRIPGVTFTRRVNESTTGAPVTPSPADTLVWGSNRAFANTHGTFTVPAGGLTTQVVLDYYDNNTPDGVELSIAQGDRTSFSTANFSLLSDGVHEWAVRQPPTSGFNVRVVDTQGGSDGGISHIGEAIAILDGTSPAGAFTIVSNTSANRTVLNMGDGGNTNTNNDVYPNAPLGTTPGSGDATREQIAIRSTANIFIPEGQWTVSVATDDGFKLRIPGVSFINRVNENTTGSPTPTPADTLVYGAPRGSNNTIGTFTVPAGGLNTTLQLDAYEAGGGDSVELWTASGHSTSFNASNFVLLKDGWQGWTVSDPSIGVSPNFAPLIGTNIQAAMQNVNATAYVRVPFAGVQPGDYDYVRLRMRWDDGFVAYLNGTEIARSTNAPASPTWNSTATNERADTQVFTPQEFTLGTAGLLTNANVLAIQGLNVSAANADFLVLPELEGVRIVEQPGHFATPTPGAANGTASLGLVGDTNFSHKRGFYSAPFNLIISTATSGAEIRYTLDGTKPTATSGTVYTGPISITGTTVLRAAAFKSGYTPSNIDTQTYLFTSDIITQAANGAAPAGWPTSWGANVVDYGMDPDIVNNPTYAATIQNDLKALPSISIVMKLGDLFDSATGIYANPSGDERTWERPTSVELINPDGSKGFQVEAGIRIRGGASRSTSNPKHAFRLFFRGEYGDSKLDFPFVGPDGADEFDKIDLRTFQNYSWSKDGDTKFTGFRDQFSRDTQVDMGHPAERGDYYHLYINGMYWGIYNTDERISGDYGESYFGGDADDYDVIKVDPDLGHSIEATDGNMDAWQELWNLLRSDHPTEPWTGTDAQYQKVLGNNPDGTRNPAYKVLIDRDNLIDYMLVNYYSGNKDGPISNFLGNNSPNNFFALRNRNGEEGWRFFSHDAEHSLLTADVNINRLGPWPAGNTLNKSNPQWFFQQLVQNDDFRMRVADRVQKYFFNNGALTPSAVAARINVRANQLRPAVVAESARWGDSKQATPRNPTHWQAEVTNILNNFVPQRTGIVFNQLRTKGWISSIDAPNYSTYGGVVPSGTNLTITNPNGSGTIYYTLDGSDPRNPDGTVGTNALTYTGAIPITQTRQVLSRVFNGTTWSAAENRTFSVDVTTLRISEVMYNPAAPPVGSSFTQGDFEFVEVHNTGSATVDLTGVQIGQGIDFTFPAMNLAPGARSVVVKNQAAFESRYGTSIPVAGVFTGSLDNDGERLTLLGATGATLMDFTFSGSWYPTTNGVGYSLVLVNPSAAPATWSTAQGWRPSTPAGGGPGVADPGVNGGSVYINEALTAGGGATGDWIEFYNPTAQPVDISNWYLSDTAANLQRYTIPAGTVVPAGGYLVLDESTSFGATFGLSELGETIYLSNRDASGGVGGYQESASFEAHDPGLTFGRYLNSAGTASFPVLISPTRQAANSGPRIGPVVINEIAYNPAAGDEYIELHNLTSQDVPLYDNTVNAGWAFTDGVTYTFPFGASIPANGYVLVVPSTISPANFRTQYAQNTGRSIPPGVTIFSGYTGALDNGGEKLTLSRPGVPDGGPLPYIDVDFFVYDDVAPWPTAPDGSGPALSRLSSGGYADDPANWAAEAPFGSAGRRNFDSVGPIPDIVDVSPDPRTTPVESINITFSEPVTGFDLADLQLTRGGAGVSLSGAVLNSTDGQTYVLASLTSLTTTPGNYVLTLVAAGSGITDFGGVALTGGNVTDAFVVLPPAPPVVQSIVFDGSPQRSMVSRIYVTFDRPVWLDTDAFSVVGRNGAGALSSVAWNNPQGDGVTWTLTFSGADVIGGSLPDGVYDLTVNAGSVRAGSSVGPTMTANHTLAFHRLYSDVDGDGDSDNADLFQMRATYGKFAGDSAYRWWFDYDSDGDVDNADVFQVRSRRNSTFIGY